MKHNTRICINFGIFKELTYFHFVIRFATKRALKMFFASTRTWWFSWQLLRMRSSMLGTWASARKSPRVLIGILYPLLTKELCGAVEKQTPVYCVKHLPVCHDLWPPLSGSGQPEWAKTVLGHLCKKCLSAFCFVFGKVLVGLGQESKISKNMIQLLICELLVYLDLRLFQIVRCKCKLRVSQFKFKIFIYLFIYIFFVVVLFITFLRLDTLVPIPV